VYRDKTDPEKQNKEMRKKKGDKEQKNKGTHKRERKYEGKDIPMITCKVTYVSVLASIPRVVL
jgi:hypothetical protein